MKISLIGAGNLATHLGRALADAGNSIELVYSRTMESAIRLATLLGCDAQNDISKINTDSDLYVLSVSDAVLPELVPQLCKGRGNGIFIHTAGSISLDVFRGHADRYGVVYPMQTFSKDRQLDFSKIPCFIEASDEDTLDNLMALCRQISNDVVVMTSGVCVKFCQSLLQHCGTYSATSWYSFRVYVSAD